MVNQLVGIENAGKTTLLQRLANENPVESGPTIGLNVKMMSREGISIKCWDLGGGSQFRQEWARYAVGCNVIIFVVDASEEESVETSKIELHRLLEERELATTPILVAGEFLCWFSSCCLWLNWVAYFLLIFVAYSRLFVYLFVCSFVRSFVLQPTKLTNRHTCPRLKL